MGEYDRKMDAQWWFFRQNAFRILAWSSVEVVFAFKQLSHHRYSWQTCRIHPHFLCWIVILSMFWKQAFPCLYCHLLSKYSMAKLMKLFTRVSQHWCISLKKVHVTKLGTSPPKSHQFSRSFPFKTSRMFGGVLLLFLRLFPTKDFGMIFTERPFCWDSSDSSNSSVKKESL